MLPVPHPLAVAASPPLPRETVRATRRPGPRPRWAVRLTGALGIAFLQVVGAGGPAFGLNTPDGGFRPGENTVSAAEGAKPPAQKSAPAQKLKAAILINLARFFSWPEASLGPAEKPFRLGILGTDPFEDYLKQESAGLTIQGHPLVLVHGKKVSDLKDCRLIFIAPDREISLDDIVSDLIRAPVLTVGDEPDFARRGGMVNLRMRGNLLSLEICREAVEITGLGIRSSLGQLKGIEWIARAGTP